MRWTERLAGWALDRLIDWFSQTPNATAEKRGERIGLLWMLVDKKHRRRADINLALAFPEKDEKWRKHVRVECFRHFGRVLSDFLRAETRWKQEIDDAVSTVGREYYDQLIDMKIGVLACTGHFGNWERMSAWISAQGNSIAVVAREANQGALQERILRIRTSAGAKVLHRGNAAIEMVKTLKRGQIIGILPDQNDDECFVPWFGHPAGTVLGPAQLQLRTGAAILVCHGTRIGVGKYEISFRKPIFVEDMDSADPTAIMARVAKELEEGVRAHPEQYLWMHDRWKSARQRGLVPPDPA